MSSRRSRGSVPSSGNPHEPKSKKGDTPEPAGTLSDKEIDETIKDPLLRALAYGDNKKYGGEGGFPPEVRGLVEDHGLDELARAGVNLGETGHLERVLKNVQFSDLEALDKFLLAFDASHFRSSLTPQVAKDREALASRLGQQIPDDMELVLHQRGLAVKDLKTKIPKWFHVPIIETMSLIFVPEHLWDKFQGQSSNHRHRLDFMEKSSQEYLEALGKALEKWPPVHLALVGRTVEDLSASPHLPELKYLLPNDSDSPLKVEGVHIFEMAFVGEEWELRRRGKIEIRQSLALFLLPDIPDLFWPHFFIDGLARSTESMEERRLLLSIPRPLLDRNATEDQVSFENERHKRRCLSILSRITPTLTSTITHLTLTHIETDAVLKALAPSLTALNSFHGDRKSVPVLLHLAKGVIIEKLGYIITTAPDRQVSTEPTSQLRHIVKILRVASQGRAIATFYIMHTGFLSELLDELYWIYEILEARNSDEVWCSVTFAYWVWIEDTDTLERYLASGSKAPKWLKCLEINEKKADRQVSKDSKQCAGS